MWENNSQVRAMLLPTIETMLEYLRLISSISSHIIKHLQDYCKQDNVNRILAYYYFDFRDSEKQKVSNLLRYLISDLCPINRHLPQNVLTLYDDCITKTPSYSELCEILLSVIQGSGQTYIVIDALDECGASSQGNETSTIQDEVLGILSSLIDLEDSKLHLVVTSRDGHSIIDKALKSKTTYNNNRYDVILHEKVNDDISTLVGSKVENKRYLSGLDSRLKELIVSSLKNKANGMYVKIMSRILNTVNLSLILFPGFGWWIAISTS